MNGKYVLALLVGLVTGLVIGVILPVDLSPFQEELNEYPSHPTFKTKTGRLWRITHGFGICEITFTDNTVIQFYDSLNIHIADLKEGHVYTVYYTGDAEPYTFEKVEEEVLG